MLRVNKGFTLTETIVGLALASIAAIAIAALFFGLVDLQKNFEMQARDEQERWDAEKQIRSFLQQAIDLRYVASSDPNALNFWDGTGSFTGAIRAFDSDTEWGKPPGTHTLAVFWREETRSTSSSISGGPPLPPTNLTSFFQRTAVYFQKPTPKTWGVLYIDPGLSVNLAPDRSDFLFEGLTRVQIKNIKTKPSIGLDPKDQEPVVSFDLELTFRKYIGVQGQSQLVFCPRALIGTSSQCQTDVPSRDLVRTIRVTLRNNVLGVSPTVDLPAPPYQGQQFGARVYDQIHFFKTATPGDLL